MRRRLANRFTSLTFDAFTKSLVDRFLSAIPADWRPTRPYDIAFPVYRQVAGFLDLSRLNALAQWQAEIAGLGAGNFESRYVGAYRLPIARPAPQSGTEFTIHRWWAGVTSEFSRGQDPSRTSRAGTGQALYMSLADIDAQSLSIRRAVSRSVHPGPVSAPPNHQRRRATATPNRSAINSEPRGASRAILLKMLNGIPGFRPASIAPLTRWTVPFTASETSATVDFGSGTGSKPS